jgi:hypothetical protein
MPTARAGAPADHWRGWVAKVCEDAMVANPAPRGVSSKPQSTDGRRRSPRRRPSPGGSSPGWSRPPISWACGTAYREGRGGEPAGRRRRIDGGKSPRSDRAVNDARAGAHRSCPGESRDAQHHQQRKCTTGPVTTWSDVDLPAPGPQRRQHDDERRRRRHQEGPDGCSAIVQQGLQHDHRSPERPGAQS